MRWSIVLEKTNHDRVTLARHIERDLPFPELHSAQTLPLTVDVRLPGPEIRRFRSPST